MSTAYGDLPRRYVARITLQFDTPVMVRASQGRQGEPASLVSDANGLPTLPGTTLAGLLRAAFHDYRHARDGAQAAREATDRIFGPATDAPGGASRLSTTWAHVHASDNVPVDGLLAPEDQRLDDPVLAAARQGSRRDHVRLGHRGAVDGTRKYENKVLDSGHRFTFDLFLRGEDRADDAAWWEILGLLADPDLRLGGGTRRGFGRFHVVACHAGCFDLFQAAERAAFCGHPARLDEPSSLQPANPTPLAARPGVTITLRNFRPRDPWLFGGGLPEQDEDAAPVAGRVIRWMDGQAHVTETPVHYLPASGIKGALAHRLAWHDNRRRKKWADSEDRPELPELSGSNNPAVQALLGVVSETRADQGQQGRLLLDDVFLEQPAATQEAMHVSLDRFAGGARAGLLFSERVATGWEGGLDYRIRVTVPPHAEGPDKPTRDALADVLDDVRRGRIAFGAGANRGNGAFVCDDVVWGDDGHWLKTGEFRDGNGQGKAA